jgi:group I intron endonuclease
MKISGIYKIQSKCKPNRSYIGSAVNIHKRWQYHHEDLRRGNHHSKKLQRHYDKYGEADLQFSVIVGCDKADLIKTEQYFIDSYRPYFNSSLTAGSTMGMSLTPEHKKKLSDAHKGKPSWNKGLHIRTNDALITWRNSGGVNHNKGKKGLLKHSDETRRKMSEAHKGRKKSEETRRNMSRAQRERPKEINRKISKAMEGNKRSLGKHHTEEAKIKISMARQASIAAKELLSFDKN